MSKVKNVRQRQARRYMIREWSREVATPTFPPAYPHACWFRFPPALMPRVMHPPTTGRRWKKLTESYRLSSKPLNQELDRLYAMMETADVLTLCKYCGVEISDHDDDGPWSAQGDFGGTGTGALSERHWCEESPDHEHSPY